MSILEAFKLALQSLWGNKMRSILTLIGVVMGVASVIMVITLVQGANTLRQHQALRLRRRRVYRDPHVQRDLLRRGVLQLSEAQDHPHRGLRGRSRMAATECSEVGRVC